MSSSKMRSKQTSMPGMRPFPKDKVVPIDAMKADELRSLYSRNEDALRTMTASSSKFVQKIEANQAHIRARLSELEGMDTIRRGMRRATITEDTPMMIDSEPEEPAPAVSNTVKVKQEAVAAWGKSSKSPQRSRTGILSFEEAIALEQQHNAFEQARRERAQARREKHIMPQRENNSGMPLSREEYEKKVWAFMNYKPSESDLEDDDDDDLDDSDEDPASYFLDEEDDGIKGQDIVYPDPEELTDVIRMDESKFHYNTFYEPRD